MSGAGCLPLKRWRAAGTCRAARTQDRLRIDESRIICQRRCAMSKSNASSIPGVGAMTDTLEFVKNMWSGMNIPGMVIPTLSVDDINKQITDLKAVEAWLTLNMNMLRGTIQALEVQSATIATLQSMGETVSAMMKPNGAGGMPSAGATPDGAASGDAGSGTAAPT